MEPYKRLLGNYPSRKLQGGNRLACGARSQKSETESYDECSPGQAVTW